jgi:hypothetical protein
VESLSPTDRICPRLPKKWPLKKNSYPGGQRGTVIANYCAEVGGEKSFGNYFDIERLAAEAVPTFRYRYYEKSLSSVVVGRPWVEAGL